jgi:hypothetical protein
MLNYLYYKINKEGDSRFDIGLYVNGSQTEEMEIRVSEDA